MKERTRKSDLPLVNEQIRASRIQVIGATGEKLGVLSLSDALASAAGAGLDLVLMTDKGSEGVPVARIMDLGKALYLKKKKLVEAKKRQKVIQIKEVKFRPKIGEHDYITKMNRGLEFLKSGKRLKITLMFRGREIATKEARGREMFEQIEKTLKEFEIFDKLVQDRDSKGGPFWSRVYYIK